MYAIQVLQRIEEYIVKQKGISDRRSLLALKGEESYGVSKRRLLLKIAINWLLQVT